MNELLNRKLSSTKYSDLYTPFYATKLIAPYLSGKVWECACGEGHITTVLNHYGLEVVETDIAFGQNFLEIDKPLGDIIVTNPPFEQKDDFLKHCYELGVPFALLLPLTAIGGVQRGKYFSKYGLELLIPDRRINFIYDNAKKACWFHSAWFCWNILPEKLIFKTMERDNTL